jgi:hypothetical protein
MSEWRVPDKGYFSCQTVATERNIDRFIFTPDLIPGAKKIELSITVKAKMSTCQNENGRILSSGQIRDLQTTTVDVATYSTSMSIDSGSIVNGPPTPPRVKSAADIMKSSSFLGIIIVLFTFTL